jgi:Ca2+-binding RTX toxin-like protein
MAIKVWGTEDVVRFPGVSVDRDAVTMLPNGGYVVTWREGTTKIGFQLYNGLGQKVGGTQFLPVGAGGAQQSASVLAFGGDGDFVITWAENSTAGKAFFSQKYTFDGSANGAPTAFGNAANSQDSTNMVTNVQEGWATAYVENNTVKLLQHDGTGTPILPAVTVYTGAAATPDVAYLGGTRHVVSYVVGSETRIKVVDGAAVGTETKILNAGAADIIALNTAAGVPSGEFIVIADKGVAGGIHAHKYTTNGTTVTDAGSLLVSGAAKPSSNDLVDATALVRGGYAVAFVAADAGDFGDIFVKVVDVNGVAGNAIKINGRAGIDGVGSQDTLSISEMADGRLAVSWRDGTLGNGLISTTIVDARTVGVTVTGTSHADIYVGTEWADNLSGAGGNDLLIAGAGADQLYGGDNNDSLLGEAGMDALNGGDGDDLLVGGSEADILDGGAGDDKASYQNSVAVIVNLGTGIGTGGEATGDTYISIEKVLGSGQDDQLTGLANVGSTLEGGAGNDWLVGGAVADRLDGGAGSDTVSYAGIAGPITINLSTGIGVNNDVLVSIENIVGTDGADTFIDDGANNVFTGGLGNDTYYVQNTGDYIAEAAGGGTETVYTTASFTLSPNVENLVGTGGGAISLTGNDLANAITGNGADNVINGGGGADTMAGGGGNDIYYVDNAGDVILDSSGIDTVVLATSMSLANFTNVENVMLSSTGAFSLDGSELANTLTGNNAANALNGFGGNDIIMGLGGNDRLNGGTGNDTIYGSTGKDTLYGGAGKDVFVFDSRSNKRTNLDKIADYVVRDDSIWLDNAAFSSKIGKGAPTAPRKLNKAFFTVGEVAKDKNDYIIYSKSKGVLYYDSDGSGGKAKVEIATMKKNLKMTAAEFFVI